MILILLTFLLVLVHGEENYGITCPKGNNKFTHVVAFGDSSTDDAGEGSGIHRYSNGPIWAEYVAQRMNAPLDNKAWGGAKSDFTNYNFGSSPQTGFWWQIDNYIPTDVSRTLHCVWIGVNDFWDGEGDPLQAAQNVVAGLLKLAEKGAKYIIVFNIMKFELAPGYSTSYNRAEFCHAYDFSSVKDVFTTKIIQFNTELKKQLSSFLPGVHCYLFDAWSFHQTVISQRIFSNYNTSWYDYRYQNAFNANQFLWWDGFHFTTRMHNLISDKLFEVVPFLNNRHFPISPACEDVSAVNRIVSFGHSFSGDTGSGINFSRNSNGPIWVEYLSKKMAVPVWSMSWSGARSDSASAFSSAPTGFSSQIQRYQSREISRTLHTISVGIFDFFNGSGNASLAVKNIFIGIQTLLDRGAKHILLINEIQWNKAPAYQTSYNSASHCHPFSYYSVRKNVSETIKVFNGLLYSKYLKFQQQNPSINILFFDAWTKHDAMFQQSTFTDTETSWFENRYDHPFDASRFMWWDGWNPTTTVHKVFADAILATFYSKLFKTK